MSIEKFFHFKKNVMRLGNYAPDIYVPPTIPDLEIRIISRDEALGVLDFDLIVSNKDFVGYLHMKFVEHATNSRAKRANFPNPYGYLMMGANSPIGSEKTATEALNLAVGQYSFSMSIFDYGVPLSEFIFCSSIMGFSLTNNPDNNIVEAECRYIKDAILS